MRVSALTHTGPDDSSPQALTHHSLQLWDSTRTYLTNNYYYNNTWTRSRGLVNPFQIGTNATNSSWPAPGLEEDSLGISGQYPASSNSSATPASSFTYYTRAPGGGLLAERGSGGATSTADYYYVQDANDSVVALTNSSDTVANTYTYDPYGTTTASTGTAPNPVGFDGGYYPSCSSTTGTGADCPSSTTSQGLILFGTRYYNPATAAWTQPDPAAGSLITDPTQADAYSFAGDEPVNSVDPSGEARASLALCATVLSLGWNATCYAVKGAVPDDGLPSGLHALFKEGESARLAQARSKLQQAIADLDCEAKTQRNLAALQADRQALGVVSADIQAEVAPPPSGGLWSEINDVIGEDPGAAGDGADG